MGQSPALRFHEGAGAAQVTRIVTQFPDQGRPVADATGYDRWRTARNAPAEFRVDGPLKHVSEFYAAFGVEEGDGMFLPAEERVKIW